MSIAAKNALLWGVKAVFRAFSPDEKPKKTSRRRVFRSACSIFYRPIV